MRKIVVLCDTKLNSKIMEKILSVIFDGLSYKIVVNPGYSSAISHLTRILTADDPYVGIYVFNAYTSNNTVLNEHVNGIKSLTYRKLESKVSFIPVMYDLPSILFFNRSRFETVIGKKIPDDIWYQGVFGSGEDALKFLIPHEHELYEMVANLVQLDTKNSKLQQIINELMSIKQEELTCDS